MDAAFQRSGKCRCSPTVYQVTIFAQSIGGSTGNTPFFAGAITVPIR